MKKALRTTSLPIEKTYPTFSHCSKKSNIQKKNHMVALWANEHVREAFSTSEPPAKELKKF